MAINSDVPSIFETAREQMQQLFNARTAAGGAARDHSHPGTVAPPAERQNISPAASLKHPAEAGNGSGNSSGSSLRAHSQASTSHGATANIEKELEMTDDLMEGDGWEGAEGAAAATTQLPTEGGVHSHQCAVDDFEESPASPKSVAAGLKLLLGSEPAELEALLRSQRAAVRSRTAAGLARVERLSAAASLGLAFLAIAALIWGHGLASLACIFRIWKERGSDLIAAMCLTLLGLRWALPRLRSLPRHLAELRQMLADIHTSVKDVNAMHADTHAIRCIMEKMSADLASKTTWIPTGVKPPAWLAGKK